MGLNVEIEWEAVNSIAVENLKDQYQNLQRDLQNRIDGTEKYGFFSSDKEEDIAEFQRHLDAFEIVLSYNMIHEDFEEWMNADELWKSER